MKTSMAGFTMIEMIIVVLIIGLLGAIAMPQFGDLTPMASGEASRSVAGALTIVAANNHVMCEMGEVAVAISSCNQAALLVDNVDLASFVITDGVAAPAGFLNCTVQSVSGGDPSMVTLRTTTLPCG